MLLNYDSLSDAELTLKMSQGVVEAFNQLYERHWKKLLNETHKRLRNIEMAEEIVQDVFANLWDKRGKKEIRNIYPYLLTSVRYQVFMLYKKQKSTPFFEEPIEDMALSHLQTDSLVIEKELKHCIQFWHSMQPEKRAEIFRLKHFEEFSTKEISEMLGISQKTVQNQLITSMASLRDFLTKYMILLGLI